MKKEEKEKPKSTRNRRCQVYGTGKMKGREIEPLEQKIKVGSKKEKKMVTEYIIKRKR